MSDALDTRLRELAGAVRVEVPSGLEAAVLARIGEAAHSRPRRLGRWIAGLFLALFGVGAVASPVGASILDWFGFHGVAVVEDQPSVTSEPTVPVEPAGMTLDEATAVAGFTPVVPAELGAPDGVAVSTDGRIVSLSWGSGDDTVRLDEFRGSIEPSFWKSVDDARIVTLSTGDGTKRRLEARLAAPTLVWTYGDLTLRLEGNDTLARATEIAESTG